ncbi:hypothetical protein ACRQ5D_15025 [Mucilaginibacter sp. P25]|uniref:hypothetical protein n=1 Tax=Mucilaginibacter sp. P25 TaxID=3423945 RepID=UPI003D7A8C42
MKNTLSKYLLIGIVIFAIATGKSYAGGFPVRPGRISLSPSATYFLPIKPGMPTAIKVPLPITVSSVHGAILYIRKLV